MEALQTKKNSTDESDALLAFIKDNEVLKASVICREIGWHQGSFSQWVNGLRPIPQDKAALLEKYLQRYGYIAK